ncbi:MAG: hypothetical protein ACHQX0_03470 [Desulfobaccales bacterium]
MTLTDNTWMQPWQSGAVSTYPGWNNWTVSPIANDPTAWEVSRVAITWSGANLEMQIFTNYPLAGLEGAGLADIALSPGSGHGSFNYGIDLRNWNSQQHLANIYSGVTWNHPNAYWAGTGDIYTGAYNPTGVTANPQVPDTVIANHSGSLGQAAVTFSNAPAGSGSVYMWDILFPAGFNADGSWNQFDFTLGSGSCANDFFAGTATDPSGNAAPIPPGFLLLATGLLALALLSYGKKAALVRADRK